MRPAFVSVGKMHVALFECVNFLCTNHAAALLAAVHPRGPAAVERSSALVQTMAAGPVVTTRAAEQILLRVCTVTGSPPAVSLPILQHREENMIVTLK